MNAAIRHPTLAEAVDLNQEIEAIDHLTTDDQVRRLLRKVFAAALLPDEHERIMERIRRRAHMNRATFRRFMRIAQSSVSEAWPA